MSAKDSIRRQMRAWRAAQEPEQLRSRSEQICLHIRSDERFARARTIHSFWPMTERGEVDLRPLLRSLRDAGRTVWLPVVQEDSLVHARFTSEDAMHTAQFGQLEPDGMREAAVNPDIILVPALAADRRGNRIGYGRGFYDRFLQGQSAFRVGVVFSGQILPLVPCDPRDEPLDALVSEAGWQVFPRRSET